MNLLSNFTHDMDNFQSKEIHKETTADFITVQKNVINVMRHIYEIFYRSRFFLFRIYSVINNMIKVGKVRC